jgi:hypothetical protein
VDDSRRLAVVSTDTPQRALYGGEVGSHHLVRRIQDRVGAVCRGHILGVPAGGAGIADGALPARDSHGPWLRGTLARRATRGEGTRQQRRRIRRRFSHTHIWMQIHPRGRKVVSTARNRPCSRKPDRGWVRGAFRPGCGRPFRGRRMSGAGLRDPQEKNARRLAVENGKRLPVAAFHLETSCAVRCGRRTRDRLSFSGTRPYTDQTERPSP